MFVAVAPNVRVDLNFTVCVSIYLYVCVIVPDWVGHLELATLLVQHDADVNRQDLNG